MKRCKSAVRNFLGWLIFDGKKVGKVYMYKSRRGLFKLDSRTPLFEANQEFLSCSFPGQWEDFFNAFGMF